MSNGNIQIPHSGKIDKELVLAKRETEKMMIEFNRLLLDKKLPENKTQGELNVEGDVVMRLLMAAGELDRLTKTSLPPQVQNEGTFGLIALLIREGFVMRDNNNKLEYKLKTIQNEFNQLKRQTTDQTRANKQGNT